MGELAARRGGFFGENRQDSVLNLPVGTVRRRFGEPERVVLYIQARPGRLDECLEETGAILRLVREVPPGGADDFRLSTAGQIISTFDGLSARIGLATVGLATVSRLIGAIGVANVMFIGVTERTREIGLRIAVGAKRREVLLQFLLEAVMISGVGGVAGVLGALSVGFLLRLFLTGFSAVAPVWAIAAGLVASVSGATGRFDGPSLKPPLGFCSSPIANEGSE